MIHDISFFTISMKNIDRIDPRLLLLFLTGQVRDKWEEKQKVQDFGLGIINFLCDHRLNFWCSQVSQKTCF